MSAKVIEDKQLNILEMMGLRRLHNHKSIDPLASDSLVIPTVDGNLQYDTPTITRVVNQFSGNIENVASYIRDKADSIGSTNLANYITTDTSDEDGQNKIFVSPPCTMTSQRTLALKKSIDLSINNMPEVLASFMMPEYNDGREILICVTTHAANSTVKDKIIRIDISNVNPEIEILDAATPEDGVDFKYAGYADENNQYIYVITNKDIRLYNCVYLRNFQLPSTSDKMGYCNIVDFYNSFTDDHKRYNDNLVIDDIHREQLIRDLINNGNFNSFVSRYFKLGNFPKNVLSPEFYQNFKRQKSDGSWELTRKPINVYDVGIVTGKFGIYQIHCYSAKSTTLNEFETDKNGKVDNIETGSLHIRCIDNKPVSDAFFYKDKGELFLVALNGYPKNASDYERATDNQYLGCTILKIDPRSSGSKIYTVSYNDRENIDNWDNSNDWNTVEPDGYISRGKYVTNINQVINAKNINGSYVNNLKYKFGDYKIQNVKVGGIFIRYAPRYKTISSPSYDYEDGANGWFISLSDKQLYNVVKTYDRHEFNCLSEYKIYNASYYDSQSAIVLDIKNVGIVEGNKVNDKNGKTGFRFNVLKNDVWNLNQLTLMNRCFVGLTDDTIYFITSSGDFNEIKLGLDISTNLDVIRYATSYESGNVLCLGSGTKVTLIYLKYRIDTSKYTNLIVDDLTKVIQSNLLDGNNVIAKSILNHIKTHHGPDSVVTKLNDILALVKGKTITESTQFSDNNHMSYIILNYPNNGDDFEFVTTDENSTDMYGRTNSRTLNANLELTTELRRDTDIVSYYDTVLDTSGNVLFSTNELTYCICRMSNVMTKITVNVPTTGTFYVDNIIGWSNGSRAGSSLLRKNLAGGYIHGAIENCMTKYQLILNRNYFNIKHVLNVTAQLASAPLKIYSNTNQFDLRHYGMYDSPVIAPLNTNILDDNLHYDISNITNDEIVLDFSIFGGDALQITILVRNN